MRAGWEYKKLGEVCEITMGQSPEGTSINDRSGVEFHQGKTCFGERFLRKSSIYTDNPIKIAEENTVLLCVRAPVGFPNITDREICIGRGLSALKPRLGLEKSFLFYVLLGKQSYFEKNATGSTFKAISSKVINQTDIPLPPIPQQRLIVFELDEINSLIALKREQLKKYDELAQSLFYEMFGDPVENEKKLLGDIITIPNGLVDPKQEPYASMIHVGPANIKSNDGTLADLKTAREEGLISGKYLFNSGMLLYSKIRPNLNKVTLASFTGICSADMYPLIPNPGIESRYLLFILRSDEFLKYAIANSGRANIPKINRDALLKFEIILPPLSLQRLFAQRIEQIEEQKKQITAAIAQLETLLASRMQYWFE